jgi:hypothetical protein
VSGAAVLLLAAVVPANGVAGRWEGAVQIADREVSIAVDLLPSAGGGGWEGSVVLTGLDVKGAPLADIAVAPPRVSFALASPRGDDGLGFRCEARVEEPGRMTGTLTRAGRATVVSLRRTGEAQVDRPPASTAVAARACGEWRGEYELFGYPRKVTLVLRNGSGPATASLVIEGRRHNELPVDLVRQEGDTLFVVSSAFGMRIEGTVSADGSEIAGGVFMGAVEVPLTLRRVRSGATS